ncbi:flagellar biosynthetic protein FliR [Roseisolibacter agri]|uniref:Flagellar biosynthetic protein FliR n=1 Tax=Roseisolibacter agri TaxID=2014610 RepID=A0AA37QFE1_9BACT|nr:flagellar biosynthetic protein FliR [Roseisolibacter agri]GLC25380.1 flagellar biosynthetic protein FliR [Roseisolibacter agri]
MPLDLFAPGAGSVAVLLALRVGGLLLVAPFFSARTIPVAIKTSLLVVLAILLAPVAYAGVTAAGNPALVAITPTTFLCETLVGIALGLGAALLVGAVETAGDLMTTSIGLSGAALFDPLNGASSNVLAQLCQMFAVTVMLAVDGHLVMLDALAESLRAVPVGSSVNVRDGLAALVASGAHLFVLGLRFAAPVVAASIIGNVALGLLTRVAPQLNVLTIAFPLQIAVGLSATVAALAFTATWLTGWTGHYAGTIETVFAGLLR